MVGAISGNTRVLHAMQVTCVCTWEISVNWKNSTKPQHWLDGNDPMQLPAITWSVFVWLDQKNKPEAAQISSTLLIEVLMLLLLARAYSRSSSCSPKAQAVQASCAELAKDASRVLLGDSVDFVFGFCPERVTDRVWCLSVTQMRFVFAAGRVASDCCYAKICRALSHVSSRKLKDGAHTLEIDLQCDT